MQVTQRDDEFGRVETSLLLIETASLPQMEEELPAIDEIHHEVQLRLCLKGVVELHQEVVRNLSQDLLLHEDMKLLPLLTQHILPDDFHRVQSIILQALHEKHFTERTTT